MRRTLFSFLAMFLTIGIAQAQINVSFNAVATADPGDPLAIDVVVSDFTDIVGIQFSINWDSTVMSYASISNISPDLPGLSMDQIGTPPGSIDISDGQTTISWFNGSTEALDLPDGSVLFTINTIAEANPCGETSIVISDDPRRIEILDGNIDDIGATFTASPVMINGPDCGGGGGGDDDLTFTVEDEQAAVGTNVCFPITVQNFTELLSGQGSVNWDPTVLSYTGITNVGVPTSDLILNESNSVAGEIIFIFDDGSPGMPETLPDGTALFEICFDIVGADGDCSDIILGEGSLEWVFSNNDGDDVVSILNNGEICAVTEVPDPVIVTLDDLTADEGSNVCVDFNVQNFNCLGFQFTVEYDDSILDFTGGMNFNLAQLNATNFNEITTDKVRVIWNPVSCESVADNSSIFQMCFDVIGACADEGTSPINIIDDTQFDISFFDCNTETLPDMINNGSVKVNACATGPECSITSFENVLCNGESTGSITVDVSSASNDCECVWTKDGNALITLPVTNCDLANIGAGTYALSVTCNGTEFCSLTQTIMQPSPIVIGGMVTNAGCGDTGSITPQVSGGTGTLTFRWLDDNSTMPNRTNLPAGTYTLEVTDGNNCVVTRDYLVTNEIDPIVVDATPTNVGCFGESTGALDLVVVGGCPDYTYQWDDAANSTTEDLSELPAGTYNVTVTDDLGTTQTASFTLTQPAEMLTVSGTITNAAGGNTGAILLMIDGGTPNYTNVWDNGIPANTSNPMNLGAGTYNVTVTDANNCTATQSFTITDTGGGLSFGTISVTSEAENGGFGVSCNGDANAAITGSVAGGSAPYTISGAGTDIMLTDAGVFMIEDLGAGSYTLVVTDATGNSDSQTLVVTEPAALQISNPIVQCANGSFEDGSISVNVAGGVEAYDFQWNVDDGTPDEILENVGIGTYSVIVTDANGCQVLRNSIRVSDCNTSGDCYEAITIITPNGDGMNDMFIINCAMDFPGTLYVYDRWGREVYTQDNYDNSWQGINNSGDALDESAYMWVLDVNFGQGRNEIYKGTVTLLR